MPTHATACTTTHNSSEPASPVRMGVWGNVYKDSDEYIDRPCRVWMFITEKGLRFASYEREHRRARHAPENGCTFYGKGARHVGLERMNVSKRRHRRLRIMNSWTRRWDAAKQVEVWTFVCEHGQVFTAELMHSNCEQSASPDGQPQAWVRTRSEPV